MGKASCTAAVTVAGMSGVATGGGLAQPASRVRTANTAIIAKAAAFLVIISTIGLHYIACVGGFKHGYTGYTG